jgi:cytochrome c551
LTAGLAGCGGGGSGKAAADPLAKADPQVQTLYKNTCLSCHGANLEGRVGPTTNLQHIGGRLTQEQIAKQIADGGGNMPGFGAKLKPDEVAALAAWLAGLK